MTETWADLQKRHREEEARWLTLFAQANRYNENKMAEKFPGGLPLLNYYILERLGMTIAQLKIKEQLDDTGP